MLRPQAAVASHNPPFEPAHRRAARYAWAALLARIYEVFPTTAASPGNPLTLSASHPSGQVKTCQAARNDASLDFLSFHAESIVGMPYDEGRALIEELARSSTTPHLPAPLVTGTAYPVGHRCVLHRATPYGAATQRRVARRCTVLGRASAVAG